MKAVVGAFRSAEGADYCIRAFLYNALPGWNCQCSPCSRVRFKNWLLLDCSVCTLRPCTVEQFIFYFIRVQVRKWTKFGSWRIKFQFSLSLCRAIIHRSMSFKLHADFDCWRNMRSLPSKIQDRWSPVYQESELIFNAGSISTLHVDTCYLYPLIVVDNNFFAYFCWKVYSLSLHARLIYSFQLHVHIRCRRSPEERFVSLSEKFDRGFNWVYRPETMFLTFQSLATRGRNMKCWSLVCTMSSYVTYRNEYLQMLGCSTPEAFLESFKNDGSPPLKPLKSDSGRTHAKNGAYPNCQSCK